MGTESTVTNIADLNKAWPLPNDPKSSGDDHIRNVKVALVNAFSGFTGAVSVTGTDGGAVNAYTLTPANPLPAYSARLTALFAPTVTNTGAVTLNISTLGAKAVLTVAGAALVGGDLTAGRIYSVIYDGTQFKLEAVTQNYIDQLVLSGVLPGQSGNAGKFLTTDGSAASFQSIDLRGAPTLDKGNSGTTAQVVNYADGEGQTLTSTGAFNLSATGWPAGKIAGIVLRLNNGGANGLTTTGISWIKADGSLSTTFSTTGIVLQTAGTNLIALFSYGDGVVYAKVA